MAKAEERSKEQINELGKIERDRRRVEILIAGMAGGYVADAHANTLVGLGNAILEVIGVLGGHLRKRGSEDQDSGEGEAPDKRRRLEEPGSWPSELRMTSEVVGDAVLKKAGTGEVDANSLNDKLRAREAVERQDNSVSTTSSDTEEEEREDKRKRSQSRDSHTSGVSERSQRGSGRVQGKSKDSSEGTEQSEESYSTGDRMHSGIRRRQLQGVRGN